MVCVNSSDLRSLRQQLERLRSELQADIHACGGAVGGREIATQALVDLARWRALAQASTERRDSREVQALYRDLARVNGALERLEKGHYGVCADCGEEIELNRLRADPAARYCLACVAVQRRSAHPRIVES